MPISLQQGAPHAYEKKTVNGDGLPWIRLLAVLAILASLFVIPMIGFWVDGRRRHRVPPIE